MSKTFDKKFEIDRSSKGFYRMTWMFMCSIIHYKMNIYTRSVTPYQTMRTVGIADFEFRNIQIATFPFKTYIHCCLNVALV